GEERRRSPPMRTMQYLKRLTAMPHRKPSTASPPNANASSDRGDNRHEPAQLAVAHRDVAGGGRGHRGGGRRAGVGARDVGGVSPLARQHRARRSPYLAAGKRHL